MNIPLIHKWVDLVLIAIIFVITNRAIQHLFADPKEYFFVKRRNKEIQDEMKVLMSKNDYIAVQEKQKEAFSLMSRQFKSLFKTMIPLLLLSLPFLYVINRFYGPIQYIVVNLSWWKFDLYGFWTFFLMTFILSLIVNNLYDKLFEKKYADYVPADYKK
jgi:uncharacterized membrane protein (DUF106 family)